MAYVTLDQLRQFAANPSHEMPGEDQYNAILKPDNFDLTPEQRAVYKEHVQKPFEMLMGHWIPLNKALGQGRAPAALLDQAAFVSAGMPDMSNPSQVRNYGHLMDMVNEGMDIAAPSDEDINGFVKRANEGQKDIKRRTVFAYSCNWEVLDLSLSAERL